MSQTAAELGFEIHISKLTSSFLQDSRRMSFLFVKTKSFKTIATSKSIVATQDVLSYQHGMPFSKFFSWQYHGIQNFFLLHIYRDRQIFFRCVDVDSKIVLRSVQMFNLPGPQKQHAVTRKT